MVIIAATVISFVYYFSPNQRFSDRGGGGSANFGSINGQRISREDFVNAQHEVLLRYFFTYGNWPDAEATHRGFDANRETYFRLLLIQKQKQLGIYVSPEAVAKVAAEILRSCGRALVFGDKSTTAPYANNPAIQIHGPGFSKILIGDDQIERWPEFIDLIVSSIASTALVMRLATSGRVIIGMVPSSDMPVA
jgi:hypothetical protein